MASRLHVHRSNRVEVLADALAALPPLTAGDPFAPEVIAVPSRGLEQWLQMRLAEARGVAANLTFTSPDALLAGAVAHALGDAPDAPDPWAPSRLRWHLLAALPAVLDLPPLAPLRRYLDRRDGDPPQRRRVVLATRVAEVLHRYTLYRPDLLAAWERDGVGGDAGADDDDWQPLLWRALAAAITRPHPGRRLAAFLDAIRARGDAALAALPPRLVLFGLNTLPPAHVDALDAIAAHREVHLFLPCASADDRAEALRVATRGENRTFRHPLLSSLDRLARDLDLLLATRPEPPTLHDHFVDPGARDPDAHDAGAPSALALFQQDLLHLRDRGAATDNPTAERRPHPHALAAHDDSLRVHVCHGAMRQVEALRDELLARFAADPTLEPRDVVVLTPDITTFAPLVQAVFADGDRGGDGGGGGDSPARGFPALHQLHDLSLQRTNPLADAFLRVLDLATGRLEQSAVLALLATPPALARADLDPDDLPRVRRWLHDAGVRWARDAADRARHGQPPDPLHTWRFGFDRLLLGHALANDGFDRFAGVSPFDDVEGKDALIVGRLVDYCERLFDTLERLRAPRDLPAWRATCATLLDDLLVSDHASAGRAQPVLDELTKLVDSAADAAFAEPLELEALRALLDAPFKARRTAITFLSGGLTFCTMVPMRSLPFRVVCLLGMDDGAFPRGAATLGFDRAAADEPRPGDRTDRDDDRQAFLEALLGARDHLVITYSGRDPTDNAALPPCGPVAELLATLERGFIGPWRVEHPLSPFSPDNFRPEAPLAFDRRFLAGARRLASARAPTPPFVPDPTAPLPEPPRDPSETAPAAAPPDELDLASLVAFFKDPTRAFLKQRLGVSLYESDDAVLDDAPLDLDGLARWAIGKDLVAWRVAGADDATARAAVRADGRLPGGNLALPLLDGADRAAARVAARVNALRAGPRRVVPLALPLALPDGAGRTLVGRVDDVFDRGAVAFHPTSARAKHLLGVWIPHLALCAAGLGPGPSWLVARNGAFSFARLDPAWAAGRLADLVALYLDGLRRPLPFAPATSDAWLDKQRRGGDKSAARFAARKAWETFFAFRGEGDTDHARLVWGDTPIYDVPGFGDVAGRVLGPLLDTRQKGPL